MKHNGVAFTRRSRKRYDRKTRAEHAQVDILRGLSKEMPPTQAMVFMSYFNQFPERYQRGHDNYFRPDAFTTISQLRLRRRMFWRMTRDLVKRGLLEQRREKRFPWPREYRIVFDKLEKYTEVRK